MIKNCRSVAEQLANLLALVLMAGSAVAAPVVTQVFSPTQFIYAGDVSNADLLTGLTPVTTGWNTTNQASPLELTDGIHGVGYQVVPGDAVQGAWTTVGATATYNLGTGANGSGFDITSMQSIADWVNVGFGNQAWTVAVKLVGGGSFVNLATVNYQPLGASGVGTTKVTLTDDSGVLATGVEFIKVTANSVNGGANAGAFVWRELDVFGTSSSVNPTPLAVSTLSPSDNSGNVAASTNLVMTFNRNIALGNGSITIKDLDTPSQTVITLPDARVSVAGSVLTINPSSDLSPATKYAVWIGTGSITDLSGNPFAGISDDTTWNFTTGTTQLRIMCMGDSITAGYTDNPTWNVPFLFGYRSGLYTRLTNAGYNFLFVGGSTEPWTGISGDPTHGGTYKPALDLRDFGQDGHRGYGGQTASYLNSNILSWLASDNPDIILLKIGTNSQDQTGLNTLVSTITTTKPNAHLIIAQIIPKYTYQQGIVDYNSYIRNTLVPNYQAQGKKVTLVNQYAPFLTNSTVLTSIDQSLFSNGINHPSNPGYDKMALVWFKGIESLGLGPSGFSSWISGYPNAAADTSFTGDPDGDGIRNGVENFFGTDPGKFSAGLIPGPVSGNVFTFTHPLNNRPAIDISSSYQWSKDLSTFHADGATDPDGTTVSFSRGTLSGGMVSVTATVTGTAISKMFVRVVVKQN
jgi:hypothetical protein